MGIRNAIGDIRFMNTLFLSAEREAESLGDEVTGVEHLLLAALAMPDDSGRRALAAAGGTAGQVRDAILATHSAALRSLGIDAPTAASASASASASTSESASLSSGADPAASAAPTRPPEGPFRSTGAAQDVFQRAVALAKLVPPKALRSAHVVLAVAELEHGTASRALQQLGIDRSALCAAAHSATGAAP